jgi:hypothetical protein
MITNMIQHYNYTRILKTNKIGAYLGRSSGQQTYSIGAFCYYPAKGVPFAVSWVEDFVVLLTFEDFVVLLGFEGFVALLAEGFVALLAHPTSRLLLACSSL